MGLDTATKTISFEDLGLELGGEFNEDVDLDALYDAMTETERDEIDSLLITAPPRNLMRHQAVPDPSAFDRWWEVFLLIGGRGTGKTVSGAYEARNHLRRMGKQARIGIGAPTNSDARDTCMEGETGLITMFRHEFEYYNRSLGEARHINGGFVKAMGTEKPKRWNGPQWSMLWFDELALCNQAAWDDANMGLRLPSCYHVKPCKVCPRPYAVCTTTPKARKWVKNLAFDKTTLVPQYEDEENGGTRLPTTFDNEFLPEGRVKWLRNKYEGSRLGLQELYGVFIDDVAGAMWRRVWIDDARQMDSAKWPRFLRIVVAIDPAGSRARKTADQNSLTEDDRQNQRKNADTAIAVVALGTDHKFYVLQIKSGQWSPKEWGMKAIKYYHKFKADKIIAEKNFGGEMVEFNIRGINEYDPKACRQLSGRNLPVKLVTASRGKDVRAEPVAALYEQRRVVHCSTFPSAEDQMCSFVDADDNEGADMVDALVWGITELGGLNIPESVIITAQDPRFRAYIVDMK
jgi:phage terminase large subunit-like protein